MGMRGASSAINQLWDSKGCDFPFRPQRPACPGAVPCSRAPRTQAVNGAASFSKNETKQALTTHMVHSIKFEFQVNNNFLSICMSPAVFGTYVH